MITPNIRYYAKMIDCTGSNKTPKYEIVEQAGFYPPMEQIKGRNGKISMYLMAKKEDAKANTPSMKLQAKDSLNFTGLKDYFKDGKLSGFAYGYPLAEATFSSKSKPNPFYEYKDDAFLFIIHQNEEAPTEAEKIKPYYIEMVVLEGAKVLAAAYCKQLVMGGFENEIEALRKQAKPY